MKHPDIRRLASSFFYVVPMVENISQNKDYTLQQKDVVFNYSPNGQDAYKGMSLNVTSVDSNLSTGNTSTELSDLPQTVLMPQNEDDEKTINLSKLHKNLIPFKPHWNLYLQSGKLVAQDVMKVVEYNNHYVWVRYQDKSVALFSPEGYKMPFAEKVKNLTVITDQSDSLGVPDEMLIYSNIRGYIAKNGLGNDVVYNVQTQSVMPIYDSQKPLIPNKKNGYELETESKNDRFWIKHSPLFKVYATNVETLRFLQSPTTMPLLSVVTPTGRILSYKAVKFIETKNHNGLLITQSGKRIFVDQQGDKTVVSNKGLRLIHKNGEAGNLDFFIEKHKDFIGEFSQEVFVKSLKSDKQKYHQNEEVDSLSFHLASQLEERKVFLDKGGDQKFKVFKTDIFDARGAHLVAPNDAYTILTQADEVIAQDVQRAVALPNGFLYMIHTDQRESLMDDQGKYIEKRVPHIEFDRDVFDRFESVYFYQVYRQEILHLAKNAILCYDKSEEKQLDGVMSRSQARASVALGLLAGALLVGIYFPTQSQHKEPQTPKMIQKAPQTPQQKKLLEEQKELQNH